MRDRPDRSVAVHRRLGTLLGACVLVAACAGHREGDGAGAEPASGAATASSSSAPGSGSTSLQMPDVVPGSTSAAPSTSVPAPDGTSSPSATSVPVTAVPPISAPSPDPPPAAPTTTVDAPPAPTSGPTRPTTTGRVFVEDCNQSDGPLAGWQFDPRSTRLEVSGGRCSTDHSTETYGGRTAHGLDLTGSFSIEARVSTPKISGDGGVNLWLVDAAGNGWGVFVGNAVHIQRITAYAHVNVTNVGVPGEATPGVRTAVVRLTRDGSTGLIRAYLDGQPWGQITDTQRIDVGRSVLVVLQNAHSPTYETWFDDLVVRSESLG